MWNLEMKGMVLLLQMRVGTKIQMWGVIFENFDAVWRFTVNPSSYRIGGIHYNACHCSESISQSD